MKRLLKWFLIVVGALAGAILGVAIWIFTNPLSAWHFAERHILPEDLKITWESMDFGLAKTDWRHWQLNWNAEKLKIEKQAPHLVVPLEHIVLTLSMASLRFTIDDLQVQAAQPVRFFASPETEPKAEHNYYEQLKTALRFFKRGQKVIEIKKLDVNVTDFQYIALDKSTAHASLKISKSPDALEFISHLTHVADAVSEMQLHGHLHLGLTDLPLFTANLNMKGPHLSVQGPLSFKYSGEVGHFTSQIGIHYSKGAQTYAANPKLRADLEASALKISVESPISGIAGPIVKINQLAAAIHIPLEAGEEWSEQPTTLKISVPIALFFIDGNLRQPIEKSCHCRIPEELLAKIDGKVWLKTLLEKASPSKRPVMDAGFSVAGVENKLFSVALGAHLQVDSESGKWNYAPTLDSLLTIHSYQGLRQYLDAKNILIPAPLDILEGVIVLRAYGPIGIAYAQGKQTEFTTALALKMDLKSNGQNVAIRTAATLKTNSEFKRVDIDVLARIDQLLLDLPPFDPLRGIPKAKRDSRILLTKPAPTPAKKPGIQVFVNLRAETTQRNAIQLKSKLADPFVPLNLLIKQSDESKPTGVLDFGAFSVTYLRRKLYVDSLKIDLAETSNHDYPVDGEFHVQQTDYKVIVHVGGTSSAPQIKLSSEPYLERADIISVLLYDRTNDQLAGGDAETVGNVQAAMADRALGLFGLWAFAATPIRSFSYNTVTKTYTATIALGDGLTAGIGTNWEQSAQVEVRKRVSKQWVLTASWAPTDEQTEVGKVVLQWERRF